MLSEVSPGNTAWLMAATAMVLLMTPGLAFFYGGMVRRDHVLVMLKMSFACLTLVTLVWYVVGYSLVFDTDVGGGLIGGLGHAFYRGVEIDSVTGAVPTTIFSTFQMAFAIITVALISGSIAGRATMRGWMVFVVVWTLLVYVPLAHWVFASDGWIHANLKALDFAGGLPVEINSGAAGLACAVVLRSRVDFERKHITPANQPLVIIGVALLWFGWFGFNAGSALQTGGAAPMAFLNTQLAAAAAMVSWPLVEKIQHGRVDMMGIASASVAGMVAITPACGEVSPLGALIIGFAAGLVCAIAVNFKYRIHVDDTLDVVGVHGWGGVVGVLGVGFFATAAMSGRTGVFFGGGFDLLWRQAVAIVVTFTFSFCMTWLIAQAINRTIGFRAKVDYEDVPGRRKEIAYDQATTAELRDRVGPLRESGGGSEDRRLLNDIVTLISERDRQRGSR